MIDDEPAKDENWSKITASGSYGFFGDRGEAMLRKLYNADRIFLHINERGEKHDTTFNISGNQPGPWEIGHNTSASERLPRGPFRAPAFGHTLVIHILKDKF